MNDPKVGLAWLLLITQAISTSFMNKQQRDTTEVIDNSTRMMNYSTLNASSVVYDKLSSIMCSKNFSQTFLFDKEVRLFALASGENFSVSSLSLLIRFDLDCNVLLANFPQQMQTMMLCRDYTGDCSILFSRTNSICGRDHPRHYELY